MTALNAAEIEAFIEEVAPGTIESFRIEDVGEGTARVRMTSAWLRPGGIVGGPNLMTLADYAVWVALIGQIGR
jgi:acyl-coenzyme A thioesterase PaaI-like protein